MPTSCYCIVENRNRVVLPTKRIRKFRTRSPVSLDWIMSQVQLPAGLTSRPAATDDHAIITHLYEIAENEDLGAPEISSGDIESSLNFPDFDLDEQSLLVFDGEELVAYADAYFWKADVAIHPRWRDRGLGQAVLNWTEATTLRHQAEGEEARIGQTVIDTNLQAIDLFKRNGYEVRHTSWVLRLPRDVNLEPRAMPEGYTVEVADLEEQTHDIYVVIEDAFNEWPNRKPSTFENWKAWTVDHPDFDPGLLFVALHEGRVVGASVGLSYPEEGWVHQIAVEKTHRNRGLAKALLSRSFDEMRNRGCPEVGLSTDSRTGALDLYLALGMEVRQSFTHYSKLLRPARASDR